MAVLKYKKSDGTYASLVNYAIKNIDIVQSSGTSTEVVMSQSAVTNALEGKANSSDVYTKDEADGKFASTSITEGFATEQWVEDKHYLTEHQSLDDYAKTTDVDASIGAATSGKVETSAYTAYTAATDEALNSKALNSDLTAHTSNTDVHLTETEKENIDLLTDNISAISGITSSGVSNWDSAYTKAPIYLAETVSTNQNSLTFPTEYINSGDTSYNGKQVIVIYHNNGSSEITLSFPSPSASFITDDNTAKTVKVKAGGYGEVSYLNINGTIFMRCV